MAVLITEECINCDACIDECPATAIVSCDDSPLEDGEFTYVKPEKCIECVDVCPTEGAIVWDMPYTGEYDEYYLLGQEEGRYNIRVHKRRGMLTPAIQPRSFREQITYEQREAHENVARD